MQAGPPDEVLSLSKDHSLRPTRREALRSVVLAAAGALAPRAAAKPGGVLVSMKGESLLDEMERRACLYFYEQSHPFTSLTRDRTRADRSDGTRVASIAATGFGLSAMCIAAER